MVSVITLIHQLPKASEVKSFITATTVASVTIPSRCWIMRGQFAQRPRGTRTVFPLALIISPTRELSCQIHEEARKFSYQTGVKVVVVYGGAPINQQLKELERGVDILVATPGSTDLIVQRVEFVQEVDKRSHLMDLLHAQKENDSNTKALTLGFVETKKEVDSLEYWLYSNGFPVTTIHGDRSQPLFLKTVSQVNINRPLNG
ncbi:hypothetical protein L2E82_18959 [Cichorium intybus]|uniref:Uncharacterized protein n=1 Tax=Cichorium intybus TaxID=13427 RepID=A0ACB9FBS9_CICIN|nr:hypothetical protein L2E82_18959 [Cichorium intybus]